MRDLAAAATFNDCKHTDHRLFDQDLTSSILLSVGGHLTMLLSASLSDDMLSEGMRI